MAWLEFAELSQEKIIRSAASPICRQDRKQDCNGQRNEQCRQQLPVARWRRRIVLDD